jgi:hypothetical protein
VVVVQPAAAALRAVQVRAARVAAAALVVARARSLARAQAPQADPARLRVTLKFKQATRLLHQSLAQRATMTAIADAAVGGVDKKLASDRLPVQRAKRKPYPSRAMPTRSESLLLSAAGRRRVDRARSYVSQPFEACEDCANVRSVQCADGCICCYRRHCKSGYQW